MKKSILVALIVITIAAFNGSAVAVKLYNAVGYVKMTAYQGEDPYPIMDYGTVALTDLLLETGDDLVQDSVGPDEVDTVSASLSGISLPVGNPFVLTGSLGMRVLGKSSTETTGSWDTEIVSMELSGTMDLPEGSGKLVLVRHDFESIDSSTGHVTVADLGGGLYHIDSFFDVFTELSVDGGQSWVSSAFPCRYDIIPEPATLGLMLVGGLAVLRRRRK